MSSTRSTTRSRAAKRSLSSRFVTWTRSTTGCVPNCSSFAAISRRLGHCSRRFPTSSSSTWRGGDGRGIASVQYRTAGRMTDLLAILREHEIVVDWPMTFVGAEGHDRALEIRVLGTSRAIQRAAADLPDGVDLDLQRLSGYEPDATRFSPSLTDRQRELFDHAFEEGYYEIPRETTHRELADQFDISAGTVGEHLQRIEGKLAASYRRG
ncbi:helix-turn-helix domain-containing protein [Natrialba sp. INN-245]|uniref:helix-turn-helix domain-containing protein n=1 Tax=Natrialba sp. INN-245 TaxID=2690967 RepID=UPI0031B6F83F